MEFKYINRCLKKKKQLQTVLNSNIPDSQFTDALTKSGASQVIYLVTEPGPKACVLSHSAASRPGP